MTPEELWPRYAAIWSLADREVALAACLAENVTYCDPNGVIEGRSALSRYMAEFQKSAPGGRFDIVSVLHHHGRTLARWKLIGADGRALQTGASFGRINAEARLSDITGFFLPTVENPI